MNNIIGKIQNKQYIENDEFQYCGMNFTCSSRYLEVYDILFVTIEKPKKIRLYNAGAQVEIAAKETKLVYPSVRILPLYDMAAVDFIFPAKLSNIGECFMQHLDTLVAAIRHYKSVCQQPFCDPNSDLYNDALQLADEHFGG